MIKWGAAIFAGTLLFLGLISSCKVTSTSHYNTDINTDTLPRWFPNDPDSSLYFYYNPDTSLFADFPRGLQEMHRDHCARCHSSYSALLIPGLSSPPLINTWEELLAYGPAKYYLAASSGTMPLDLPMPDSVLRLANQALTSAANRGLLNTNTYIEGINDPVINGLVHKYCAECHGFNGISLHKANLSTYEKWVEIAEDVQYVLEEDEMLPDDALKYEEWKADTTSQKLLLDWIMDGLPNDINSEK